jgi:tripartite-type tricarboxylate transporter receptor subunit TctC
LLLARAGIKAVHVPYKSGAEMVTAVLGEQVQMTFPDISILLPLIRDKKLKALAVTSAARHPELPDVPTMAESGIADYVTTFWTGVVAPAGTPADVIGKLNGALNAGLKSPQLHDSLVKGGAQPAPGTPQDFANFIAAETRKWSAIAQTAGLSPQ